MKFIYDSKFKKNLDKFPESIQAKVDKQLGFLVIDIRHPSLRAKKYSESEDTWQARIDDNVRFYFKIEGDTYVLINIKNHPK